MDYEKYEIAVVRKLPVQLTIVYYLFYFFVYQEAQTLLRYQHVSDYIVLREAGCGSLYPLFTAVSLSLGISTLIVMKQRNLRGLIVPCLFLIVSAAFELFVFYLIIQNPDVARNAYEHSRVFRGMHVNEQGLAFMFSTTGIFVMLLSAMFFKFIPAILLVWKKDYYLSQSET